MQQNLEDLLWNLFTVTGNPNYYVLKNKVKNKDKNK
jgi:hypothetical protein